MKKSYYICICNYLSLNHLKFYIMEKQVNDKVNKGSTVHDAINKLQKEGTLKTNDSMFKSIMNMLRTNYDKLVRNKVLTVDYSNFEITLN